MKVPDARREADGATPDRAFVDDLLRAGIIAMPGSLLGAGGEGYVRWALVPTPEECREAIARLDRVGT